MPTLNVSTTADIQSFCICVIVYLSRFHDFCLIGFMVLVFLHSVCHVIEVCSI